jgi:6-phosphogluconolactonase
MTSQSPATVLVYVGAFTRLPPHPRGNAEGIVVARLDPTSGTLTPVETVPDVANPSFLALHPSRRFLYAVNAVPEQDGRPGGSVSTFAVEPATGGLTFLNRQPSHGASPCHVRVDPTGRWVLTANYGGGSVAILPILEDGRLGPATDTVQHAGSSVDPERQAGPHAHSINLDPTGAFALVADLGLDRVFMYRVDWRQGRLVPHDPPSVELAPGSGPRHLAFHPNGRLVYVLNELGSTLTAFAYDATHGSLRELQTLSTLPAGFSGANACADVHVTPDGRFVYGSNRGHDSLAIFAIDETTGRLTSVGHAPTGGRTPRNFAIDPSGTFLYAANQDSDTIVTFRIDAATGQLTPAGPVAHVPSPTCLEMAW